MRSLRGALGAMTPRPAPPREDYGLCPHNQFEAVVTVVRVASDGESVEAFRAAVVVTCEQCGERMQWLGEPDRARPTCADNGLTLHVPMRPASEDPTVGGGW